MLFVKGLSVNDVKGIVILISVKYNEKHIIEMNLGLRRMNLRNFDVNLMAKL